MFRIRPRLMGIFVSVGCAVTVVPALPAQTNYYVKGSCGDDTWTGVRAACRAPGGPKLTIQAGIDAAITGDTVSVADGTYTGPLNKNLDYHGKGITVRSANGADSCIIDFENDGRGFDFHSGEGASAVLDGFTITNGKVGYLGGGAIRCQASSPTITNCTIVGNEAKEGGGILGWYFHGTISNCRIQGNLALDNGNRAPGGKFSLGRSNPTIVNCLITGNRAYAAGNGQGPAVYCDDSDPTFVNCTISGNTSDGGGDGNIHATDFSDVTITNCILWGNSPPELYNILSSFTVTYCVVAGGASGTGNLNVNPLFVDPAGGDYRLSAGSLCIDSGDNTAVPPGTTTDLDGNPRFFDDPGTPDTGNGDPPIVDRGAYEFQPFRPGDLNCDGAFNGADIDPFFLVLGDTAAYILAFPNCDYMLADMNGDGFVNGADIDPFFRCLGGGGCP